MLERIAAYLLNENLNGTSEQMGNSSLCQRLCELPHMLLGIETRGRNGNLQPLAREALGSDRNPTPLQRVQKAELQNLFKLYYAEENTTQTKDTAKTGDAKSYSDNEAGKQCEICSTHFKTHFAIPCGHSSCLSCWSRWLIHNPNCMVCQTKVTQIKRYSLSLVPKNIYETSRSAKAESKDLTLLALDIENCFERAVRSLLEVKDACRDVVDKLETVEGHLYALTRRESGTTVDALASVLAVECVQVAEVLGAYKAVFKRQGSSVSKWKAMDAELSKLLSAVAVAQLRINTKKKATTVDEPFPAAGITALEDALTTLCLPTSIAGQWNHIKTLLHKCSNSHHLIPGILAVFGIIHSSSSSLLEAGPGTLADVAQGVMELAETSQKATNESVNALLKTHVPKLLTDLNKCKASTQTAAVVVS